MNYKYVAYNKDKKIVKGSMSAAGEDKVTNYLTSIGYKVISIKATSSFMDKLQTYLSFSLTPPAKPKEIVMFSRQLALLVESGIDIVTAIDLLKAQATNKHLKEVYTKIVENLRAGESLSNALSKHPRIFPTMYHRSVAAGEQSGDLAIVLRRMADYMERMTAVTKKIKSALTYPIIVVVVGIVVAAIIVFFVLPTFTKLYESMGANLPAISKALINIATGAQHYGGYVIIGLIVLIIVAVIYIRTPDGRKKKDRLVLRLPVIGKIVQLNELARFSRTTSMLINVGLPLPDILSLCAQGSSNTIVAESIMDVKKDMLSGEGLSQPMTKRPLFLPLIIQMTAVGEKTGNLGKTLVTVADSYEAEADDRTTAAVGLLQPALTIIMAIAVGFIAVAMVSAMYGIYGQLGGSSGA